MKVTPNTGFWRDLTRFDANAINALEGGIPPEVIVMAGKHLLDVNEDDQEILDALEAGIPAEVIVEAGKHTESEIEDSIVKTFREVNPPLETLTLDIKNSSFYEPLLEMFSQTLKSLDLKFYDDHNPERLEQLIEALPNLEKLTLQESHRCTAFGDNSDRDEIGLKSMSLKELTIHSPIHFGTLACPSLTQLDIRHKRMLFRTLNDVAHGLEELELYIGDELDLEIYGSKMTTAIENLPKLKKLIITAPTGTKLVIKSRSLEQIDAMNYPSNHRFVIEECICPSLKLFEYDEYSRNTPAVRPVSAFREEDLPQEKETKDFKVGERPFVGMHVPDACVVRVHHDWFYHLYYRFV